MRPPLSETVVNSFMAIRQPPDTQDVNEDPTLADDDSGEGVGDEDLDGDDYGLG